MWICNNSLTEPSFTGSFHGSAKQNISWKSGVHISWKTWRTFHEYLGRISDVYFVKVGGTIPY